MTKKRILIISKSFYPRNSPRAFRTTELVKEFGREGHEVTLLTVKRDKYHIPFEKKYGVTIRNLGPLQLPEINLTNSTGISRLIKRGVRRGLLQLFEYPNIELMFKVKNALKKESGYDLLISIAVPHPIHWGVAWAWKMNNPIAHTWAADCGDPYMWQTLDSFNKMFYFKYFEKSFCRKANFITVPIEEARKGYYPEFRDKVRVIPQGFNFGEIEIDHSSFSSNTVPTFAYAGGFIPGGRDPREFLDYLVQIEQPYKFIIFTRSKDLVKPYLERANGKIEIHDYIPRKELLRRLSKMDFLVNFENRSNLMMPSKLIDYYLAGRPVLNIPSKGINKYTINQFLVANYRNKYNYNGVDRYRIENVCDQFLSLCEEIQVANES
ncbi:glycosyltransferase [Fodinibius saliphilus]|uniref:glycosyltransferase n=1 Tax=Fodinibius saliphilus TaxID=1920650 RepID=UPI001485D08C|nr:glycosyltransferase [Fodinibius saliphilus]